MIENNGQLKALIKNDDLFRWSVREFVARKMSSTIWGQGFIFQSDDENVEKKFKRFDKMNNLTNLCGFIEKYASLYGRCIVTINKTDTGDIMLNVPNPFYFNGVGKAFVQPQLAVIYQRVIVDTQNYVLKTTYTTRDVTNEIFMSGQNETLRVFDKQDVVMKELRIQKHWVHNLGFVPVVEITNLPFFQFDWNNEEFVKIADWYPAYIFEDLMISTIKNFKKELAYCHSRLVTENTDQRFITELKNKVQDGDDIDVSDFIIQTDSGAEFKAVPGNGDFTKYTNALDHIMDFYFKFCGGSRFSEGGGAQKTVAETSSVRSAMIESINNKILLREKQFNDLFRKVLCALTGKEYWGDDEFFRFSINGNVLKDETSYIDNIQKKIDMQTMSVVDAIQELFDLTKKEAQAKFDEVKKFNEENGLDLKSMVNEMNGDGEKPMNELGEHKDAAKHGEQ